MCAHFSFVLPDCCVNTVSTTVQKYCLTSSGIFHQYVHICMLLLYTFVCFCTHFVCYCCMCVSVHTLYVCVTRSPCEHSECHSTEVLPDERRCIPPTHHQGHHERRHRHNNTQHKSVAQQSGSRGVGEQGE